MMTIQRLITIVILVLLLMMNGYAKANGENILQTDEKQVTVQPNRPTVSELRIRGRIQGQFAFSDGSNSNTTTKAGGYSSFEMRRIRLGAQGKLYGSWKFMVEANVLSNVELDAAILTYRRYPEANVTFGKAKPRFGYEQNTSSASILTIERTRLDGHLNGGKPLGMRVHGSWRPFSYYLGIYNGQATATGRMSIGQDTYLYNASIGLDAGSFLHNGINGEMRADYLYNADGSGYYKYENAFAGSARVGWEAFDLRAEFMTGTQHNGHRLSGFYVMPSWFIVPESIQAVLRFENMDGDSDIGLGHNRYADRLSDLYGAGDDYYAIYAGINYYIYGDNLKLMLGAELAENSGSAGVSGRSMTVYSGCRMQF